jgi:hypothetical protein
MAYVAKVKNGNNNIPVGHTLYGTCSTESNTAAKIVVMPDFSSLVDGVTIKVAFTNSNTAENPTLNVNSTGAKSIYRYGTTRPGTTADSSWEAGSVLSFTYDGSSWMMNDYQNGGGGGTGHGIPAGGTTGQILTKTSGTDYDADWADKPSYTASDVGALAASDIPTTTVAFTEASTRANIATGESIATLFGKIKKIFSDLGSAAFKNVPSSGNAGSSEVVLGNDTRLSDARTANGGNADYATQAGKVGHYLRHKVVREYAGNASGVKFYTIDSFNGYSETESITSFRFRTQVKTTDWSSTTDASGYYYWSFNIMPNTQLFEHMRPNCKLVGSDDDTLPTSAEITAYNLVNYANGVSGGVYTEFTLFAKTKPTTNFYVEFSGICA